MSTSTAPVLSTPDDHIFDIATPLAIPADRLSDEQLYVQYEIHRTVREIREGRWKRVGLQFPDTMLVDAPRVSETLSQELKSARKATTAYSVSTRDHGDIAAGVAKIGLAEVEQDALDEEKQDALAEAKQDAQYEVKQAALDEVKQDALAEAKQDALNEVKQDGQLSKEDLDEYITILGDTSYGACCVDEIAAEHVDADVVVHYGRSCLSPTARLPVIYVFTSQSLDSDAIVSAFVSTYPDPNTKVVLMADIPYQSYVPPLSQRLQQAGYTGLFAPEILHNPSSLLPNRTIPPGVQDSPSNLKDYSVFHLSNPPNSLLLTLSSRVSSIHVHSTETSSETNTTNASALLRRRYALLTTVSTAPILGILINTLSVKNYLVALQHCQTLIKAAGKKSYVFVVGKLNSAKLANFAEIGGWVVIGCWESSLVDSADFYKPVITPFELEIALTRERDRIWGGEWVGDFGALLGREAKAVAATPAADESQDNHSTIETSATSWEDETSDDEPPEFDLRTGRYVSQSRPMGRAKPIPTSLSALNHSAAGPSSALIQRNKGDLATINGVASPGAEFLRSQRTWTGLGSEQRIEYERDEEGRIRGAGMEEGREGVARGYAVAGSSEG